MAQKTDPVERFYGLRHPRLKASQKAHLTNLKDISLPCLQGKTTKTLQAKDVLSFFPFSPQKLILEIGFGRGELLVSSAKNNPTTGFIGSEGFLPGIASILSSIKQYRLNNICLYPYNAFHLLKYLPATFLDEVWLFHPDPWPKKRHIKRRFLQSSTLRHLHHCLKPKAKFLLASDQAFYIDWAMCQIQLTHQFTLTSKTPLQWHKCCLPFITRYQKKALERGVKNYYLSFHKC